uniref:Uncharacterized protein n=1 Tax=Panagrolaimus sp. ES5 TaxID=591445 RepID=A0AC34FX52_9BILA
MEKHEIEKEMNDDDVNVVLQKFAEGDFEYVDEDDANDSGFDVVCEWTNNSDNFETYNLQDEFLNFRRNLIGKYKKLDYPSFFETPIKKTPSATNFSLEKDEEKIEMDDADIDGILYKLAEGVYECEFEDDDIDEDEKANLEYVEQKVFVSHNLPPLLSIMI